MTTSLSIDHKATPEWAWPGSRDPISQFWDPCHNFRTNQAIHFKFGTMVEDRPFLHTDHKTTPKWAWPRSREPILKFWEPLISRTNRIRFKFGT